MATLASERAPNTMLMHSSSNMHEAPGFSCKVWICGRYLLPANTTHFDQNKIKEYLLPLTASRNKVVKQKTTMKIFKTNIRLGEKGLLSRVPIEVISLDKISTAFSFDHLPDILVIGLTEPHSSSQYSPLQVQRCITVLQFGTSEVLRQAAKLLNLYKKERSAGSGFHIVDPEPTNRTTGSNWVLHPDNVDAANSTAVAVVEPAPAMVPAVLKPAPAPVQSSVEPVYAVVKKTEHMTEYAVKKTQPKGAAVAQVNGTNDYPRKVINSTSSEHSVVRDLMAISTSEKYQPHSHAHKPMSSHSHTELGEVIFDDYSDMDHRHSGHFVSATTMERPSQHTTLITTNTDCVDDGLMDCEILEDEPTPVVQRRVHENNVHDARVYRRADSATSFDIDGSIMTSPSEALVTTGGGESHRIRQIARQAPYLPGVTPTSSVMQVAPVQVAPVVTPVPQQPTYYVVKPQRYDSHYEMMTNGSVKGHVVRPIEQVYFTHRSSQNPTRYVQVPHHRHHRHHHKSYYRNDYYPLRDL